ncbi:cytochrome c oxidase assembly factor Coa1 family protein [Aquimarina sp. 2304DJ70-9]|uniref:cytochrome c oxidase assembly factor Coa1 family protein n=1 Tax=Aquimarina penaris TaxID=3231044 RepID=UPI0034624292
MNETILKKSWWKTNWKWLLPVSVILCCITFFFLMTGNATLRYGSVLAQPDLINNAHEKAKVNEKVIEKLGELSPHDFFRLLEGEVMYSNNDKTLAITVGIIGSRGRGKLDIIAQRNKKTWEYQKITVRIKKPKKETIKIFEK